MDFSKHLTIPGWCPVELMQYLNTAVSEMPKDQKYLEIGSFCGRSLAAALHNNCAKAIVIDPQDLVVGNSTSEILWNKTVEDFSIRERITLYKYKCEDFWGRHLLLEDGHRALPEIGVFFLDGNHDSGHTYEALKKFSKFLADEALIIVDDYNIYGGNAQTPYPGYVVDVKHPVKTDVDWWISRNKNHVVDVKYTPWLNGQAVIKWQR